MLTGRYTARRDPSCSRECGALGGCPTGEARITGAGRIAHARHVIHAVGPVWSGGKAGEPELLASCHRWAIALAAEHGCRRVAFPAISTGVYGYPLELAARVALDATAEALEQHPQVEEARFWLFDARAHAVVRVRSRGARAAPANRSERRSRDACPLRAGAAEGCGGVAGRAACRAVAAGGERALVSRSRAVAGRARSCSCGSGRCAPAKCASSAAPRPRGRSSAFAWKPRREGGAHRRRSRRVLHDARTSTAIQPCSCCSSGSRATSSRSSSWKPGSPARPSASRSSTSTSTSRPRAAERLASAAASGRRGAPGGRRHLPGRRLVRSHDAAAALGDRRTWAASRSPRRSHACGRGAPSRRPPRRRPRRATPPIRPPKCRSPPAPAGIRRAGDDAAGRAVARVPVDGALPRHRPVPAARAHRGARPARLASARAVGRQPGPHCSRRSRERRARIVDGGDGLPARRELLGAAALPAHGLERPAHGRPQRADRLAGVDREDDRRARRALPPRASTSRWATSPTSTTCPTTPRSPSRCRAKKRRR